MNMTLDDNDDKSCLRKPQLNQNQSFANDKAVLPAESSKENILAIKESSDDDMQGLSAEIPVRQE